MARIVVVRLDGVGDALLTAPLFVALHRAGHEVGGVFRPQNAGLFRPQKLQLHCLRDGGDVARVAAELQAAAYDCALIVSEKPVAYRLAKLAGIARRIGFHNGLIKPFKTFWLRSQLTHGYRREATDSGRHEAEQIFALGQSFVRESEATRDAGALRGLLTVSEFHNESGAPFVAIQITSKLTELGDAAAIADFCLTIKASTQQRRLACILIGAAAEAALVGAVAQAAGLPHLLFSEIAPWVSTIAAAAVLVTPDCGAAHVAGMLNVPCIDIFAAESTPALRARWQPWLGPFVALTMAEVRTIGATVIEAAFVHLYDDHGMQLSGWR